MVPLTLVPLSPLAIFWPQEPREQTSNRAVGWGLAFQRSLIEAVQLLSVSFPSFWRSCGILRGWRDGTDDRRFDPIPRIHAFNADIGGG